MRICILLFVVGTFLSTRAIRFSQAASGTGPLRAGAAAGNITPWLGVSMNGGFQDRKATHIHDELHARAIVLDNGTTRVAIVLCDSCLIHREIFDEAKRLAEARTGIPAANMLMAATHTHSGATVMPLFQSDPDPAYQQFLIRRIADAIACASNNLAPARIGWGSGAEPDQLFNRRWYMKPEFFRPNPFGVLDKVCMNPPRAHVDLLEPAGPTDPDVTVFAIQSGQGRPVAVLANYGLHYVGGTGPGHISADYYGVFADRIQALLQADRLDPSFVGVLSNGTSGDVNNINFRVAGASAQPYEQIRVVANDVAGEAARVIQGMSYESNIVLAVQTSTLTLGVRRPSPQRIEAARAILASAKPGELEERDQVFANEAIKLAEYPATVDITLQVIRIGDAAIAAVPCEVFAGIGLDIKSRSPFKTTCVVSLANGYHGYLPTPKQHELGGYETWPARSSYLEEGASPKIVARLTEMLENLR